MGNPQRYKEGFDGYAVKGRFSSHVGKRKRMFLAHVADEYRAIDAAIRRVTP
jgi:hypothetical protein